MTSSIHSAADSSCSSLPPGAMSCKPTGMPPSSSPTGIDIEHRVSELATQVLFKAAIFAAR